MTTETDKLVEMAEASGFTAYNGVIYCEGNIITEELADFRDRIIASLCEDVEPFVFEEYPYLYEAMGCGLEDRNITDRYEAMAYGWERAMERAAEAIPDGAIYPASTVAALKAERDAALARVAVLEGVIDRVLLDIDDDGVAEAQDIAVLAMRNIRNGRPQYEGLDALTKGQP